MNNQLAEKGANLASNSDRRGFLEAITDIDPGACKLLATPTKLWLQWEANRFFCKQAGVILTVAVVVFGSWANLNSGQICCAGGAIFLLSFVEAGYAALSRHSEELAFSPNRGRAECLKNSHFELGIRETLGAFSEVSVWPFYLALFFLICFASSMQRISPARVEASVSAVGTASTAAGAPQAAPAVSVPVGKVTAEKSAKLASETKPSPPPQTRNTSPAPRLPHLAPMNMTSVQERGQSPQPAR